MYRLESVHTPISKYFSTALAMSSEDLLAGTPNSVVRQNAVHFLTMSSLLGAVLILIRWMQLSGAEEVVGGEGGVGGATLGGAVGVELGWLLMYLVSIGLVMYLKPNGTRCVQLTLAVVLLEGIVVMLRWSLGLDPGYGGGVEGNALVGVLIVLTLGASLLPWSPKQTIGLALVWIVGSTATLLAVTSGNDGSIVATILGYIFVTIPGIMVSFFRVTRIKDRFEVDYFQTQYERIHQELAAAKNIHERAFPQPRTAGDVRFAYSYRPMSQIGGDYLFASVRNDEPESPVLIVLLDVSGHGIPAALTVNQLQGELMQLVGENPSVGPGELLGSLDRYICLTSPENPVLVTGIAACFDPEKNLMKIANAGHPGALLRGASGGLVQIDATGPMMGIDPTADIRWEVEEHPFESKDSLIAFTDGITEAMDADGEMFGVEGIRKVIESGWIEPGQRWPELVRRSVDRYCEGVVNDDMLIVDVYRP